MLNWLPNPFSFMTGVIETYTGFSCFDFWYPWYVFVKWCSTKKVSPCPIVKTLVTCTYGPNLFIHQPPFVQRVTISLYNVYSFSLSDLTWYIITIMTTSVVILKYKSNRIFGYIFLNTHRYRSYVCT